MNTRICAIVLLVIGAWAVRGAPVSASDPVGIYAVVEKVVFEPSESAPERVQIWGAFALADKKNNDDYQAAQKGYLYYSCPSNRPRTCANEWADLKSVAGSGTGVGFGGRFISTGRVRQASEQPASPEPYPIRMGVVRMTGGEYHGGIVAKLKAALSAR